MHLTKGLYPFWDDLMTDARFTDATLSVNHPDRVGNVFSTDAPWEGNNSDFFSIIREDGFYRMYYLGWQNARSRARFEADQGDHGMLYGKSRRDSLGPSRAGHPEI